jgi:hypothetical protein
VEDILAEPEFDEYFLGDLSGSISIVILMAMFLSKHVRSYLNAKTQSFRKTNQFMTYKKDRLLHCCIFTLPLAIPADPVLAFPKTVIIKCIKNI